MSVTIIILIILNVAFFWFAYSKGKHAEGLAVAKDLFIEIIPVLILALVLAGMLRAVIPTEFIAKWIGKEAGIKGIFIGAIAGGFLPGGPIIAMPVVVTFIELGATIPVIVAMITGWSLFAFHRIPIELGILGPKITLIRLASVFVLAPMAGLIAKVIVKIFKIG